MDNYLTLRNSVISNYVVESLEPVFSKMCQNDQYLMISLLCESKTCQTHTERRTVVAKGWKWRDWGAIGGSIKRKPSKKNHWSVEKPL